MSILCHNLSLCYQVKIALDKQMFFSYSQQKHPSLNNSYLCLKKMIIVSIWSKDQRPNNVHYSVQALTLLILTGIHLFAFGDSATPSLIESTSSKLTRSPSINNLAPVSSIINFSTTPSETISSFL